MPKQTKAAFGMRLTVFSPTRLKRSVGRAFFCSTAANKWEGRVSMVQGASRGIGLEFVRIMLVFLFTQSFVFGFKTVEIHHFAHASDSREFSFPIEFWLQRPSRVFSAYCLWLSKSLFGILILRLVALLASHVTISLHQRYPDYNIL